MRFAPIALVLTMPLLAQIDSASLRAKFGPPLNREVFRATQEFDIVVDYGKDGAASTLRVPTEMPISGLGPHRPGEVMRAFLDDLMPASLQTTPQIVREARQFVVEFRSPNDIQLVRTELLTRFGSPLHREAFRAPEGFDVVADYGPDRQVCRIEIPGEAPTPAASRYKLSDARTAFLDDLVPETMRGKKLGDSYWALGGLLQTIIIYEHLAIFISDVAERVPTIAIQFRRDGCS